MTVHFSRLRRAGGPALLLLLVGLGFVAIRANEPPYAAGGDAPAAEFSAARAMADLRVIAARPHPVASADEARVRDYLVNRLGELGASPAVETATASGAGRTGPRTFAVIHNIIGRIRGTASTGALMLVAHYDSVTSGAGAGDDGASVAAILETLRALRKAPPMRNDLIVLFTDGEELGMVGARGFVENYPSLSDIKVVLNFEMRGDYGPSMMFQTSAGNQWLIRALAAAPYPRASSLAPAIYKRLPNDTDLTVFMGAGLTGMNFAATGGLQRYHTRLDDVAHMDTRTLQHQGSYALALARRFGAIDLGAAHSAEDGVYFNLASALPRYPVFLALPLAIIAVLVTFGVTAAGMRRGRISVGGFVVGFAVFAAAIAIAGAASQIVWRLVETFAGSQMLPSHTTYGAVYFARASLALTFAALWAFYAVMLRIAEPANLAAGALAGWSVAAIECAGALAGGSYLLVWPLFGAAIALHLWMNGSRPPSPAAISVAAVLAMAPAIVLLNPLLHLSREGTPMFLAAAAILSALIFGLAIPYLDWLGGGSRWIAPGALVIAAAVLFEIGCHASAFSAEQPRPDTIFYLLDATTGSASWESLDRAPDRWTAQFFRHHVRLGSLAGATGMTDVTPSDPRTARYDPNQLFSRVGGGLTIEADAPAEQLAPPELTVVGDSQSDRVRTLRMHIASARHAPIIWIAIPPGVEALGSSADGESARDRESDGYTAWFWNVPETGFDLSLRLAQSGPVRVTVIDQTNDLPPAAIAGFRPRPADVMPSPFVFFDSATLVRKLYVVGGSGSSQVRRRAGCARVQGG
jgi:hypothetical protein